MTWLNKYIPAPVADFIAFALTLWLLPLLARQFQNLSFFNSVLMGLFFLLFCFAVYALKRLRYMMEADADLPALELDSRTLSILGVLFALSISAATAYVVGFLDSVVAINRGLLDEPSVTIYLLLTPASWFGLALIYVLVLTNETKKTVVPSSIGYSLVSLLGLTGVNIIGLVFTAVWQAIWARFDGVEVTTAMVLINAVWFLLLLGPPRLIYLSRNRRLISVVTFLPLVLYLAVLAAP